MITDGIINLGFLLLHLFNLILPTSDGLPSNFQDSLHTFFSNAYAFNNVLPIDSLLTVFGILVTFEIGIMVYRFTRWIFASIPLSNIKH